MANKKTTSSGKSNKSQQRALRAQQAVFVMIGIIVILSMVISMIAK